MRKKVVSIVVAALISSCIEMLSACGGKDNSQASRRAAKPTPVVVTTVGVRMFADKIEALGTALAYESVVITAEVTGRVVKINFTDGDRVDQGDVLVELDNDEEAAALAAAEANLATQETQNKRLQDLVRKRSASQTALDEQANLLKQAVANLAIARARLRKRSIKTPFAGQLGIRQVSLGALVGPGDEIVTLDDLSRIKLDFSVPEIALSSLQRGAGIEASSAAYPQRTFGGEVTTVSTRVDPVTRTVIVRAELPNDAALLKPGMLLTVDLASNRARSLAVPEASLVPLEDKQFVYRIVDGNTVERVAVAIGRRQPGIVEVLTGLRAGDQVITEGTTRVAPNAEVTIVDSPTGGVEAKPAKVGGEQKSGSKTDDTAQPSSGSAA